MQLTSEIDPVVKVGGVLLRKVGNSYEVLITQPRPQNAGYHTAMGLVRGTRRYKDAQGNLVDANRDGQPQPDGVEWEPFTRTLGAELHEEAGLSPEHLALQQVYEIGTRPFASRRRTHDVYPIHWFAVVLDEKAQASLPHTGRTIKTKEIEPDSLYDSLKSEWVSLARLRELGAVPYNAESEDRLHPEYLTIAEEAVKGIEQGKFLQLHAPLVGKPTFTERLYKAATAEKSL